MSNYNISDYKFYIGVDLHKKKSYLYVIDNQGNKKNAKEILTMQKEFEDFFSDYSSPEIIVAVEISSLTFWFCDVLQSLGIVVYVVNTLENHYLSHSVKKTDKEDARKLAIQMWKDILPYPVYIPKKEERLIRDLISQRQSIVRNLTRIINRTYYLLANYEIKFNRRALTSPKRWELLQKYFDGSFEGNQEKKGKGLNIEKRIESIIATNEFLHKQYRLQYNQYQLYKDQLTEVETDIHSHIEAVPRLNRMLQLLLTIPGVGKITGSALIGIIGDIERFKSCRQLSSYLGLCPKIRESAGKSLSNGKITKRGNGVLRGYLVQAAMALLSSRKSEALFLKEWYERIRKKKGWRTARIALARKLVLIVFAVLRKNIPFDSSMLTKEKNPIKIDA